MTRTAAAALLGVMLAACSHGRTVPVTIETHGGQHVFHAELARTAAEQAHGLMGRGAIGADAGMLFAPYRPGGDGPAVASFWMKDTPSALDILFIRPDGTIANIAADAVPFSDTYLMSNGPVSAVFEIRGGRAEQLGIRAGDRVTWPASATHVAPSLAPRVAPSRLLR